MPRIEYTDFYSIMLRFRYTIFAVMILLIGALCVKPVQAKEGSVDLFLDSGFVGRSVSFRLFDGEVVLSWDAKMLLAPTKMTVRRFNGGASSSADVLEVDFENTSSIYASGTMSVVQRGLRPPTSFERAEVLVSASSTASSTAQYASFAGTSISYQVPARPHLFLTPVYRIGVMCSGLASWYRYKGCDCAASPDYPKGTILKVSRQDDSSRFVLVKVNDYGPDRSIHPERVIDLDRVAFQKIGNPRGGVMAVTVEKVE